MVIFFQITDYIEGTYIKGTEMMQFISYIGIPGDKNPTYTPFIVNYRPQK